MGRFKSVFIATIVVLALAAAVFVVYTVTRPAVPDQLIPDPLAFTVVDGTPIARACIDLRVDEQELTVYSGDEDVEGTVKWTASGETSLPAGTEFALGEPLDGFTVTGAFPADLLSLEYGYSLNVIDRGDIFALFTHQQLVEGSWTDSLGDPMPVPCNHVPCDPDVNCINDWTQPTGRETDPLPTFVPTPVATIAP